MGRLDGKVMLVTGAGSGIGRASAIIAAREGARLVLADIVEEPGEKTRLAIEEEGGHATFVRTDVTDEDSVRALLVEAHAAYGDVTTLFACAGLWRPAKDGRITDLEVDAWNEILDVNLKGTFLIAKYTIPQMLSAGGGSIITVASDAALRAQRGVGSAYTASKGGVLALSRLLGLELARKSIRVNAVCPGPIRTELTADVQDRYDVSTPVGRTGRPEDIAWAVTYLASDESSFVTGTSFVVDGGLDALLPM